jgi:hypothetical protein
MFITFLGGVGTVTGSKYLLTNGDSRLGARASDDKVWAFSALV